MQASPTCLSHSICKVRYFMHCQNLYQQQVGNGQYVALLFVIPVIIEIHRHLFEVFTLVSEIHDNVDLVLGMKNAYELEGIVDT